MKKKTPKERMELALQLWLDEVVNLIEPAHAESVCTNLGSVRKYHANTRTDTFGKHLPTVIVIVRHAAACCDRAWYCESCERLAYHVTLVPPAAHPKRRGLAVKAQRIEVSEADWRPAHLIPEDEYA